MWCCASSAPVPNFSLFNFLWNCKFFQELLPSFPRALFLFLIICCQRWNHSDKWFLMAHNHQQLIRMLCITGFRHVHHLGIYDQTSSFIWLVVVASGSGNGSSHMLCTDFPLLNKVSILVIEQNKSTSAQHIHAATHSLIFIYIV